MRYLLDSDALIAAKNLHYRPDFCQGFWEWIEHGCLAQKLFSIDTVYKELRSGDPTDFLHGWSKQVNDDNGFFLSTKGCLGEWGRLVNWVTSKNYRQGAIDKFLNPEAADAWLIAFALSNQDINKYTIVTNEASAPLSFKSIKLPDAAKAMGIPVMGLYDLLSKHGPNNFKFQP